MGDRLSHDLTAGAPRAPPLRSPALRLGGRQIFSFQKLPACCASVALAGPGRRSAGPPLEYILLYRTIGPQIAVFSERCRKYS
jgi:hypothetical protein